MSAIPEGFQEIPRLSPFNRLVGPLYQRRDADAVSIGLRIEEKRDLASDARPIVHASAIFARGG
jgi:hypothetical protein